MLGLSSKFRLAWSAFHAILCMQASHWSKVAELQRILAETPRARAEWIMYMTDDAIIDDIAMTIPFEKYQGKDVVLIGFPDRLKAGDAAGASHHSSSCERVCRASPQRQARTAQQTVAVTWAATQQLWMLVRLPGRREGLPVLVKLESSCKGLYAVCGSQRMTFMLTWTLHILRT